MEHSLSTGATCVCPQLNTRKDISLNPFSSVFTAECAAISMAIDLANHNRELTYTICSDSLSAIQTISGKPYNMATNSYIVRIKEGLQDFAANSPSDNSITLLWVPAHRNINGNELADEAAKEASLKPPDFHPVPYTDFHHSLKQKMNDQAESAWTREASHKGTNYFRQYHSTAKNPWFHNLRIPRFTSSWVSRYRAGHYGLGASLAKIGVGSANCPCGHNEQDLNHILWDCPNPPLPQNRKHMLTKMKQHGWTPPLKVEPFLQGPNLYAIRIISEFLKTSNIKV
ncbi:hypothetical protein ANTPLA_LOCUS8956 [Anthophora plagiata]